MTMFTKVEAEIKLHTGDDVKIVHLARQPLVCADYTELRAFCAGGSVFYARLYKGAHHVSSWSKSPVQAQEGK